ncbi:hypothetical protein ACQ3I4_05640 [Zafaria sp. Z1313]|uniref:hypothetical protein n=1 Tax=unclassified Zafaria TaxID=2828765 RepID=UPI002E7632A7|nr:hypothetical protein [Zafaria sp. J156]MEE1621264.1 hypothetical protein [Zafaria sp. J156]
MEPLPAAYEQYLASLDEHTAHALRPAFVESVHEHEFGVLVRGLGSHHAQALVDEHVPYGEIKVV